MCIISLKDFAADWGLDSAAVPREFRDYFAQVNTSHQPTDKNDLEEYLDAFLKKTNKSSARRNDEQNLDIFEQGWAEHRRLLEQECGLASVMPKYYTNLLPYYIGGDGRLYKFDNRALGADLQVLQMRYLALTKFKSAGAVHEFGSGSGLNLLAISSTVPGLPLVGYEWTESGVELADMIGRLSGRPVSGRHFDMLNPDESVDLEGQAVLTCLSIEQLGDRHQAFLDFLIRKKPALVVHLEPDTTTAVGSVYLELAHLYMKMRGYTLTLTQTLRRLEAEGRLTIEFCRRLPWISNFNNWACTIWKPR